MLSRWLVCQIYFNFRTCLRPVICESEEEIPNIFTRNKVVEFSDIFGSVIVYSKQQMKSHFCQTTAYSQNIVAGFNRTVTCGNLDIITDNKCKVKETSGPFVIKLKFAIVVLSRIILSQLHYRLNLIFESTPGAKFIFKFNDYTKLLKIETHRCTVLEIFSSFASWRYVTAST